jgi:hypothetical protein
LIFFAPFAPLRETAFASQLEWLPGIKELSRQGAKAQKEEETKRNRNTFSDEPND